MLLVMIGQEMMDQRRADYMANMLWSLTGAVFSAFGGRFPVKSWGEMIDPPKQPNTGEDIKDYLLARWGGGE